MEEESVPLALAAASLPRGGFMAAVPGPRDNGADGGARAGSFVASSPARGVAGGARVGTASLPSPSPMRAPLGGRGGWDGGASIRAGASSSQVIRTAASLSGASALSQARTVLVQLRQALEAALAGN
jgi:hypothetical protein